MKPASMTTAVKRSPNECHNNYNFFSLTVSLSVLCFAEQLPERQKVISLFSVLLPAKEEKIN